MSNNLEIQKRVAVNYRNGDVVKLPRQRREILTFIGKTNAVPIEDLINPSKRNYKRETI